MPSPRPSDDDIESLYPDHYEPYQFKSLPRVVAIFRNLRERRRLTDVAEFLSERSKILDLGCGNGSFLEILRNTLPSAELAGWDFGAKVEELANKFVGIEFLPPTVEALQTYPERYNGIFALQVVEHFSDPLQILEIIHKLLVVGGVAVIETPNCDSFDFKLFFARHWGGYHAPRHLAIFPTKTLERHLERMGFTVLRKQYMTSPAFWIQSFHHYAADRGVPEIVVRLLSIKNPFLLALFVLIDGVRKLVVPTSNVRLVVQKV